MPTPNTRNSEEWIVIADASEIPSGYRKCVQIGDQSILLFHLDGEYHAIEDNCTHLNLPLSNGELYGTEIVCPWHGAAFEVTSGQSFGPPAKRNLVYYPLRMKNKKIEIRLKEIK